MSNPDKVELRFTLEFQRKLKRIYKKNRSVQSDLEPC